MVQYRQQLHSMLHARVPPFIDPPTVCLQYLAGKQEWVYCRSGQPELLGCSTHPVSTALAGWQYTPWCWTHTSTHTYVHMYSLCQHTSTHPVLRTQPSQPAARPLLMPRVADAPPPPCTAAGCPSPKLPTPQAPLTCCHINQPHLKIPSPTPLVY
jgi:hypothetical protein